MKALSRASLPAALLVLVVGAAPANAASVGGVEIEPTHDSAAGTLQLNGAGLRKRLFIELYVAALYTEDGSGTAADIVAADAPMAITLDIVSNRVTRERMVAALEDGFAASTGGDTAPIRAEIDAMLAAMDAEIVAGSSYALVYEPGVGTRMVADGQPGAVIEGLPFKQALFGIWLSDEPVAAGLKSDMLGG